MLDERIQFEESVTVENSDVIVAFFKIDKSLLEEIFPFDYPEAESGTISIGYSNAKPFNALTWKTTSAKISPTTDYHDYDWSDFECNIELIKDLVTAADERIKECEK